MPDIFIVAGEDNTFISVKLYAKGKIANFGISLDRDNRIVFLSPGGLADKDGQIKVGDVIEIVNGKKCDSLIQTLDAIENAYPVLELVLKRRQTKLPIHGKFLSNR